MYPEIEFVRNRQPLGALGIFNERNFEKDTNVQNRFLSRHDFSSRIWWK